MSNNVEEVEFLQAELVFLKIINWRKIKKLKRKRFVAKYIICNIDFIYLDIHENIPDGVYFISSSDLNSYYYNNITQYKVILHHDQNSFTMDMFDRQFPLYVVFKNKNEYLKWKLKCV